ncbi:MAG: ATP-dependent nuclease [Inquilinaceae bacterium]
MHSDKFEDSGNELASSTLPSNDPVVTFHTIQFSDGTNVSLDENDIIVLVGPNNAGKSLALRELETMLGSHSSGRVLNFASIQLSGTIDDVRDFLGKNGKISQIDNGNIYTGFGFSIKEADISRYWPSNLRPLTAIFCARITTENRIIDSNSQASIDVLRQPPTHPIHILYSNDIIEKRISDYFYRAFGKELIVLRAGGSQSPLLVGKRPNISPGNDRVSASYLQDLYQMTDPLEKQGDGMRSFASVILHMLAPRTQSILLLDEPEAFLHPPQARLLGEFIAKEKPDRSQLFIATHSSDILQGLLNVASDHLRIIRIDRHGNVNRAKELDKSLTKSLSRDPLMKSSSVLSGIFHKRVIIAESDADCMFYNAILDVPSVRGEKNPDVLFIHPGGKHRLSKLANSLTALDVSVDVIVDFDVLKDESVLQDIIVALRGDWKSIQTLAHRVKTAIEQSKPWLDSNQVATNIRDILDRAPKVGGFPRTMRNEINSVFRRSSPWEAVKEAGETAVPGGQPTQNWQDLKILCQRSGLWIVPVGELEGFCKSVGGHGPAWVREVLERRDLANGPQLELAREFVRQLWQSKSDETETVSIQS